MKPNNGEAIQLISKRLVYNYFCNSDRKNLYKEIVTNSEYGEMQSDRIVIVVVGAGASADAGMRTTEEAVNKIEKMYIPGTISEEVYEAEKQYLKETRGLNPNDFETRLAALCQWAGIRKKIPRDLRQLYGHTSCRSYTYEILAHLLKHRFIDAVINFNFDELLDVAVEDELGKNQYIQVISDSQNPLLAIDADNAAKRQTPALPIYIKPHGTVGVPSSMRFTQEDYAGLPADITQSMENIIKDRPLTLIVIGFRLMSEKFNNILSKAELQDSEMIIVNKEWPEIPCLGDVFSSTKSHFIRVEGGTTLASIHTDVYEKILNKIPQYYKPRGVDRHQIMGKILRSGGPGEGDRRRAFLDVLQDGVYLEIALSLAKGKGVVDICKAGDSRSGRCYGRYVEAMQKRGMEDQVMALRSFCENLDLKNISYSHEVYALSCVDPNIGILDINNSENALDRLWERTVEQLSLVTRSEARRSRQDCKEWLYKLYKASEVEIEAQGSVESNLIFRKPIALSTKLSLVHETLQLISMKEWEKILVVAETGEWLLNSVVEEKLRGKKIRLIVAYPTQTKALEKLYPNCIEIKKLPWWLHNRHLSLTVSSDMNGNYHLCDAIYFQRKQRTPFIHPVMISEEADLENALNVFYAYWKKGSNLNEPDPWIRALTLKDSELLSFLNDI